MTASPARLRLLLIQAALRTAERSLQRWAEPLPHEVDRALTQLRQMVAQLGGSLDGGASEIQRDLQSVYLYLFRTVTEAQLRADAEKLQEVVKVLQIEHRTWTVLAERSTSAIQAGGWSPEAGGLSF
jgi:flagellar protein FliS